MTQARGGYLVHNASLIRAMGGEHTSSLERPVSQVDLDALNSVQRVPWRINRRVYEVAAAALDAGLSIAGLVTQSPPALDGKLPDAVWDEMDTEARQAHVAARRLKHTAFASATGKRHATLDKLGVAEELLDQPAIWYPHSRDFRGRFYPIPNHGPHPQGDDLSKSLIEFASGKPLGGSGLYWLLVRAANHAGQDKLPLDERMAWTLDRAEAVCEYAADPLENTGWADMEEPWQFLATCFELAEALGMDDPSTFVSHLPVSLDGTCNGLQHLSALGRDRLGGEAVNLTSNPERQDIYQRVADAVAAAVELDAAAGKPEAMAWRGLVGRKVVKRAVMTTPLTD